MEQAKEIISNKIDALKEQMGCKCIEEDAEDYQFIDYYQIKILEEILRELGEIDMNEDKIIRICNKLIADLKCFQEMRKKDKENADEEMIDWAELVKAAIQGLLDLYQKEKQKNRWKPISEYDREKYDWVLVKYFDGDYECVPEVAEQRWDGKWYTTEREIPFEVKYFFDMQELLEERN